MLKSIHFAITCRGRYKRSCSFPKKNLNMNYRGTNHLSMPQDNLSFFKVSRSQTNSEKIKVN